MLSATDPVDAFGFESGGLHLMRPKFDSDGEMLVFGSIRGQPTLPSLGNCAHCHGPTVGARLFANGNGRDSWIGATTWSKQAELILSLQEQKESWQTYRKFANDFAVLARRDCVLLILFGVPRKHVNDP